MNLNSPLYPMEEKIPPYTHYDADGMWWRLAGIRRVSWLADRTMSDVGLPLNGGLDPRLVPQELPKIDVMQAWKKCSERVVSKVWTVLLRKRDNTCFTVWFGDSGNAFKHKPLVGQLRKNS